MNSRPSGFDILLSCFIAGVVIANIILVFTYLGSIVGFITIGTLIVLFIFLIIYIQTP